MLAHLMARRGWFFTISAALILPGLVSLALFGLRLGIDFTGGSLLQYRMSTAAQPAEVQRIFAEAGLNAVQVQTTVPKDGAQSVIVRAPHMDIGQIERVETALRASYGEVVRETADTVGPLVGEQTSRNAVLATLVASAIILAYIWWAFRRVDRPWRYGACAVIALLHDVLLVLGLWSILGETLDFEIDALFVTGILTVVGFSVHDTVVVFDRIRENLARRAAATFEDTVNASLVQTMVRSLNTSLTVLFTLLALAVFGGPSIRNFVLVLLVGVVTGTYSSIFNASALLVSWENGDLGRLPRLWRGVSLRSLAGARGPASVPEP